MKKVLKRIFSLFLALVMMTSVLFGLDFSVSAQMDDDFYSNYKFSYLSELEAKAFIGFLLGKNDINEKIFTTDIYYYLIGNFSNDKQKESEARIAFIEIVTRLLNARINEYEGQANLASSNLVTFLQNKYGVNMDSELVNSAINKEMGSIKDMILGFVAIATETDLVELELVETIFNDVRVIVNYKEKVNEYFECINAIFDLTKFISSVQHLDMYKQFLIYISNAKCYLNFGNTSLANSIIELNQDLYDLYNERSGWTYCIESIVKKIDFFVFLNDYWLDWNTDDRIALLKKWACFIVYTQVASENDVTTVMTDYELVSNTITTSSGKTYTYNSRTYKNKIILTHQIDISDLNYTISDNQVTITDYIGYDGKYDYISIPSSIKGYPVVKIGKNAFEDLTISSVIIPESVSIIDDYAFNGCYKLNKIVILNDNVVFGLKVFDWVMGNADQSIGNVPVYCNPNSNADKFCNNNQGFVSKPLAWNGTDVWGVAATNGEYHIHSGAELNYISNLVNSGADLKGFTVVLDNDINMNSKEISAIGFTKSFPFKGSFNGNDYSINKLKTKSYDNYSGLFGYVIPDNSFFKDLKINGVLAQTDVFGASLIAFVDMKNSNIVIKNINVNLSNSGIYSYNKGGIVGQITSLGNSNMLFENCINSGIIESYSAYGGNVTGGVIGRCELTESDTITFYRCANNGTVRSEGRYQSSWTATGGLLGAGTKGNYIFKECAVDREVYSKSGSCTVGGLSGTIAPNGISIENCEIFANLKCDGIGSGNHCKAGFIGTLDGANISEVSILEINNSYVSSVISPGNVNLGFMFASGNTNYSFAINNSYFDREKTKLQREFFIGRGDIAGIYILDNSKWINSKFVNSEVLKTNSYLYENWDFENTWSYSQSGYPILKCFSDIQPCSSHTYKSVVTEPTCTVQGYTTNTCTNCGYVYKSNYTNKLEHLFTFTKVVAPTCAAEGYDLYTCSRCNATEKRNTVPTISHDYVVTGHQDPTCNTPGFNKYTCLRCSHSYQDEVPVLDGSALKAALDRAKNCLERDYYTEESKDNFRPIYEQYKDSPNTLTTQKAVDDATTDILESISSLVLKDSAEESTEDGFSWKWNKETGKLSIFGEGNMPEYTATTMPWIDVLPYTTSVEIEEGITSIGGYAFYKAKNIKSVSLPESLETINSYAFYACENLDNVVIPDKVTYVGGASFKNCTELKNISVPANAVYYGRRNFGDYAFNGDTAIKNILITKGIDGIMPNVSYGSGFPFYWQAGPYAPWNYAENAVVTLGEGVTVVGENTFSECEGITEINISKTVSELNLDRCVFYCNFGLEKIFVDPANETYCSLDNCLYSKDMTEFLLYPQGSAKTEFVMPESVKKIRSYAIRDCNNLEIINLKNVENVGEYSLLECDNLKKVIICNKDCSFDGKPIAYTSTIYGYSGSTAETFANTNSIAFVPLADTTNFKVKTVSLSLANNVKMNFKVLKTAIAGFENPYLEITKNGKVTVIDEFASQGDYYVFTFKDIAPQTMNDNVCAVLHATNNDIDYESEPYNFSVAKYAYGMLGIYNTDQYAKLRTLLVDLLNYGAAAQLYQGYKIDNLVNAKLTDEQKAWGTITVPTFKNVSDMKYETVDNPEISWKSVGLQLNSSVAVRYKFTAENIKDIKFKVTCQDREWVYTSADFVDNGDGTYSLWFNGLNADDMQKDVFITAYKGDNAVSNTLRYSVESYAKQVEDYMPNSKLQALTRAMMQYGISASNYA